jgi:hypothetical protein
MVRAGLGYLAAADPAAMPAETQAQCLLALEQADSVETAARAWILGAFTAGQGYSADAEYSVTGWLVTRRVSFHDNAPCDVEAEAGALSNVLGGVEGFERAGRHLRRHAPAGVPDLDDDVLAFGPRRQPERARTSVLATHSRPGSRADPGSTLAARSHQARSTPAAASGGAIIHSSATSWLISHDDKASSRSARASGSRTAARESISWRRASSAANCRPEISSRASLSTEESSVWHAVSSASTARVVAAARLLISCARPAESVPRVTRESRCRAVDSMERAVRYKPSMRCLASGNQTLNRSRSTCAGTRSTRPSIAPRPVAR